MKKKILLQILLAICILAVLAFATMIIRELYIDEQSRTFYDNIANETKTRPSGANNIGTDGRTDEDVYSWIPYVDFEALSSRYPGIVGWIKLEGTPINYPVMQYSNNDHFLTRLPDGTSHRSGSIFLDYRNKSDFSDKSILIYGHESRTNEMFATLKSYRNQEFYNENPIIHLYTPENDYEIIIFAGHLAHSQRDHPPMHFEDDEEFLTYINYIKSISLLSSDVEVSADDSIVNLCTCAYDFDEARLVLVGKKVLITPSEN